jgi:DNA topoisomerase-1
MPLDPATRREAARDAGLRWTSDERPGIRRRRAGRGFSYRDPDGVPVRDPEVLARIRSLAIPPAWTDVWICPDPRGHVQATGRDAKGRKQHRYHPAFREQRERAKYERMLQFARLLPGIRERVDLDLARPGLPREKVLAAVVRLLELTLIRVGNEEYARLNRSFGLTTLRDRHATVEGSRLRFRFRGKSGVRHEVTLRDRRLARVVARCQDLPGQDLLQYVDEDGEVRDVRSEDVNEYLREITGGDVTAKDFRTWAGTVLTYRALLALQPGRTEREVRRNVVEAVRRTAESLGNTPAVARRSYVHPAVLEAYLDGGIADALVEAAEAQEAPPAGTTPDEEEGVADLLRQRLDLDASRSRPDTPR